MWRLIYVLQSSRAVFQYGIMTGRCSRNPASEIDAETVLKKSAGVRHMARVKPVEIPQLTRAIAEYQGDVVTRLALRFMALTFVRTTEVIKAEWTEFDETPHRRTADFGRAHEDARSAHRSAVAPCA